MPGSSAQLMAGEFAPSPPPSQSQLNMRSRQSSTHTDPNHFVTSPSLSHQRLPSNKYCTPSIVEGSVKTSTTDEDGPGYEREGMARLRKLYKYAKMLFDLSKSSCQALRENCAQRPLSTIFPCATRRTCVPLVSGAFSTETVYHAVMRIFIHFAVEPIQPGGGLK